MKTNRIKWIVLAAFVLTLGAGIVSGFLTARISHADAIAPAVAGMGNASLAEELELTAEQRKNMQLIWERVRDLADESYKSSRILQSQRDDSIRALIPADKIEQYNKILRDCQDENAVLKGRRDAAFTQAVKQTNEMLSAPQQKKYAEILAKRLGAERASVHDPMGQTAETSATHSKRYAGL